MRVISLLDRIFIRSIERFPGVGTILIAAYNVTAFASLANAAVV